MPPLSIPWLRGGRGAGSLATSSWISPAQRAVRVLQVTRANWPLLSGKHLKKRREPEGTPHGR